jgi:hypothetical protein
MVAELANRVDIGTGHPRVLAAPGHAYRFPAASGRLVTRHARAGRGRCGQDHSEGDAVRATLRARRPLVTGCCCNRGRIFVLMAALSAPRLLDGVLAHARDDIPRARTLLRAPR